MLAGAFQKQMCKSNKQTRANQFFLCTDQQHPGSSKVLLLNEKGHTWTRKQTKQIQTTKRNMFKSTCLDNHPALAQIQRLRFFTRRVLGCRWTCLTTRGLMSKAGVKQGRAAGERPELTEGEENAKTKRRRRRGKIHTHR